MDQKGHAVEGPEAFQAVHVGRERGGQGGSGPIRKPGDRSKSPQAPGTWRQQEDRVGDPTGRVDEGQEILLPAAISERAHHEHADDVETVHHPEGRRGRGGSKTPIDGIRNKMCSQNRRCETANKIGPGHLPEGQRAQGNVPGIGLQRPRCCMHALCWAPISRPWVAVGQEPQVCGIVPEEDIGQGPGYHKNERPQGHPGHAPVRPLQHVHGKGDEEQPARRGASGAQAQHGGALALKPPGQEGAGGRQRRPARGNRHQQAKDYDEEHNVESQCQEECGAPKDRQAHQDDLPSPKRIKDLAQQGLAETINQGADGGHQ